MTLNFYTLGVIYLVYSFLGWVAETVVATIRGGRFANRGAAAGPFCFIYGTTGVLLAVSFGDLRTEPVYLFFACMMAATVMEWITAKLLERLHRRKWWDYSGKKFNLNGYVCLQYSLLWGALGTASVLWGNDVLLRLCAQIPVWLLRPAVWVSLTVAVLDQIGSAVLVGRYAAKHPVLEQLNQRLGESSDGLRRRIALYVEKRIQRAYPEAARRQPTAVQKGESRLPQHGRPAVAVCHRGVSGRHGGDGVLPRDRRGLDEPLQSGLGAVQRGVGSGAGAGGCVELPRHADRCQDACHRRGRLNRRGPLGDGDAAAAYRGGKTRLYALHCPEAFDKAAAGPRGHGADSRAEYPRSH